MLTILHLMRCSAFSNNNLQDCLANLTKQDALVLIDDGCYTVNHPCLTEVIEDFNVFIITEHALARGLNIQANINSITLSELTDLLFTHHSVVTWQ